MNADHEELKAFKTEINLTELMASFGYSLDRKSSSRNSVAMKHQDGDKLIITRTSEGRWVYFSVRSPDDNGTVLDFLGRRTGENLGQIRRRLRDWMGAAGQRALQHPETVAHAPSLEPITRDLDAVRSRYEQARSVHGYNRYLVEERAIPVEVLSLPIFEDRIRVDSRGNILFPHQAGEEITGYEVRSARFKGYAKGGIKGLWTSRSNEYTRRLVIGESALDMLSYAAVAGHQQTRFASIAGQLNRVQPQLVVSEIGSLPPESEVVLAMDNDEAGDKLIEQLARGFEMADRGDLELRVDRPPTRGMDFNDVLRTIRPTPLSNHPGPCP